MSTKPIDYEALARQHGGAPSAPAQAQAVDYAALAKQYGGRPIEPGRSMSAQPERFSLPWIKGKMYEFADLILDSMPGVGATIGGVAGAAGGGASTGGPGAVPGAIGGAALGGAAGEGAAQLGREAIFGEGPKTSEEAATRMATEGVIQGGVEAATAGLGKLVPPLKRAAVGQFRRALHPTTLENKTIAEEIAPELVQRGVRGNVEAIEKRAGQEIEKLRPQLEAAYAALPGGPIAAKSPISTTLTSLEKLKGKYIVDGKIVNQQAWNAIEGVQEIVEKHANNISPQSLRRIKQIFGEAVSEAGGYTTADLATNYSLRAQKEAAGAIRRILHDAYPNVAALDKEMSFWLDVQQVTRATNQRQIGQQGGLTRAVVLPFLGAAGAGLELGGQREGAVGAALTAVGILAVRSQRWRTTSAVFKDRLADALARQDVRTAMALASRLGLSRLEIAGAIQGATTGDGQSAQKAEPQ